MPNDAALMGEVTTGTVDSFAPVRITRTWSAAARVIAAEEHHRSATFLQEGAAQSRRAALVEQWQDDLRGVVARFSGVELLEHLWAVGISWRDVARLVGVSVPAVQKWRRGEGIATANLLKIAGLVAVIERLRRNLISEPVSWLEMPLREGVALSALDLLADGRTDLVLELASDEYSTAQVARVLDEYEPRWRETLVDGAFETFRAADGVISIRPRI